MSFFITIAEKMLAIVDWHAFPELPEEIRLSMKRPMERKAITMTEG
jgi:hypothetical protein